MERDRPWLFRTYAGHSTAAASNALYRGNLAKGQTGLSVAFDLPTQTGYDSDHELARGEVGKVGVPICHLGDMRALFDAIPLQQMNTSMTINATAPWLLALYVAVAEEQGADIAALQGTVQNDIVKEYLSRGTYICPPEPSLRMITDVAAWTRERMPRWNPMNVCSYHLQEAGATPQQELAYALATATAVLDDLRGKVAPEHFPQMVGRISFFVNAGIRFVTEMCKMRAFVELWDEICRERYGVEDEKLRRFRYGVQVNSLGLTEQQPENNVVRILLEMLAVTLSKNARARAVQLPAWNEALGLPRPWDQQWSLRMQQILAYETDLLEYGDLFDGNPAVAARVAALKQGARDELDTIDAMGGAVRAIEHMKARLVESNADRIARIEAGETVVVGVNRWTEAEPSPLTTGPDAIMTVDPAVEADQVVSALPVARRAQRVRGPGRPCRPALRRRHRRQHHAALDRRGAGRRHHRRVGRRDPRRLRPVPRADRRQPGPFEPHRGARRDPRRGGRRLGPAGRAAEVPRRQARPRRPFQRRRADRRARPRLRHGDRLRGHPPDPGRDRRGGIGRRRTSSASRSCRAATCRSSPRRWPRLRDAGLGHLPVVVGGIIPEADAERLRALGVARVYTPKDFELNRIMTDIVALTEPATVAAE